MQEPIEDNLFQVVSEETEDLTSDSGDNIVDVPNAFRVMLNITNNKIYKLCS